MKESAIQSGILHYLSLLENQGKVYCFRNNSYAGYIQRADGGVGYIKNNKPGMPDIVCCKEGRFIGLEVKNEAGRLSEAQKAARDAIQEAGGEYYLVRSIDDVQNIIEN